MKWLKRLWPFVLKSTHERIVFETVQELRDFEDHHHREHGIWLDQYRQIREQAALERLELEKRHKNLCDLAAKHDMNSPGPIVVLPKE